MTRADNHPAGRTIETMRPGTAAVTDDTRPGTTNRGSLRHLLAAVLLVLAGACQLLPRPDGPIGNGEIRRLPASNPNLELPHHADIETLDGRRPLVLGRERAATGELVRVEHLEPGTYTITWPGNGYGGRHFPAKASIVVVEAIDAGRAGNTFDNEVALASAALLVLLALALLAGRAARSSRQRIIAGGLLALLLGSWGGSGWSAPTTPALLSISMATIALAVVLSSKAHPDGAYILAAGVGILLWPSTLVGGLATLLAIVTMRHILCGSAANDSIDARRRLLLPGAALVLLLAAGAWAGHAGDVGNGLVRLGSVTDEGLDFADCLERERGDKTLGRECFRALGARLGANLPPEEASQALLSGLGSVGIRQDSQCRTAGGALSYGAARWGIGRANPRALFVELAPICDYSSMHGIVAGTFAHSDPAQFASDVLLLCAPTSPDETRLNSPEYSRQCWQAAGIAIGRRTRYADPTALLFCEQAAPYGMNNCTDGYFQELVDQKARVGATPAARLYPEGTSVLSLCSSLPGKLAGGCYRYVGEEVFYEGGTRQEGLFKLQRVCTETVPGDHRSPCWYALGMVSVRTLLSGSFPELAAPVQEICPNAPTEETLLQCLHGGGNALIGLLGEAAPTEAICSWFPAVRREEFCGYTERYRDHLREGDPTN